MTYKFCQTYEFRPHFKSHPPRMIDVRSGHRTDVHLSWPKAYLARLLRRSSSLAAYQTARLEFLQRLLEWGVDPLLLAHFRAISYQYCLPRDPSTSVSTRMLYALAGTDRLWCVMPYHPVWHAAISSAARRASSSPSLPVDLIEAFGFQPDLNVSVSWKLALGRNLKSFTRYLPSVNGWLDG